MLVLHHLFIVNGNGYRWAQTKQPEDGGYLVYRARVDQRRKYDAPYGKTKFKDRSSMRELLNLHFRAWRKRITENFMNWYPEGLMKKLVIEDLANHEAEEKYPNDILKLRVYPFDIEYSPIRNIDLVNLKPDWRAGMIEVYEYALLRVKKAKRKDYEGVNSKSQIIVHLKKALKLLEAADAKSA